MNKIKCYRDAEDYIFMDKGDQCCPYAILFEELDSNTISIQKDNINICISKRDIFI